MKESRLSKIKMSNWALVHGLRLPVTAKLQSAGVDAVKTVIAALDKFCGRLVAGLQDLDSVLAELTPARNRRQIALASR